MYIVHGNGKITFDVSICLNSDDDDVHEEHVHKMYIVYRNARITFDISICLNSEPPTMSVLKLLSRMWLCLGSPDHDTMVNDHDENNENVDDNGDDHNGGHDNEDAVIDTQIINLWRNLMASWPQG